MELRHLRYFVAVADAEKMRMEPMRNHPRNVSVYVRVIHTRHSGSLTVAAARKLNTSQPSLSRQIRDLEDEVGAQLLTPAVLAASN